MTNFLTPFAGGSLPPPLSGLALLAMVASLGLKYGSGEPYPGSIVFVLGHIFACWSTQFMYPFWRKP